MQGNIQRREEATTKEERKGTTKSGGKACISKRVSGAGKSPALIFKEAIMKIFKRVLAVTILVLAALIISYLIYTGGQLHA